MTEEEKEILKKYSELKIQEKQISEIVKELHPTVVEIMVRQFGDEKGVVESDIGKLSLTHLRKYIYPQYVLDAEAYLEKLKEESEAKGDGTYETKPSVRFT